jgi:hypothetical protein
MNTNRWGDIGYHSLVSKDGKLWQGRASSHFSGGTIQPG